MKRKAIKLYIVSFLIFFSAGMHPGFAQKNNKASQTNAAVTAIDPGRFDASWWNRAPVRLVQTNLREIDATMDVNAYIQSMVDASASVVLSHKATLSVQEHVYERRSGRRFSERLACKRNKSDRTI
jgi:hypothetical protein